MKCTRCLLEINVEGFSEKRNGGYYKMCDHCRKKARERYHKLKQANKDKYKCSQCDYKSHSNGALTKHVNRMHKKKTNALPDIVQDIVLAYCFDITL